MQKAISKHFKQSFCNDAGFHCMAQKTRGDLRLIIKILL